MSKIVERIVDVSAPRIEEAARSACQSRTLRQALRLVRTDDGFTLSVPHYWAQWFNGGRGPVNARPGHKLVFYKNPGDDPRISGGYPVRLSDVRKLTKEEFYRDLRAGKLIVTDSVGPAPPHEFMGDALTLRAAQILSEVSAEACRQAVRDELGPLFNSSVDTTL